MNDVHPIFKKALAVIGGEKEPMKAHEKALGEDFVLSDRGTLCHAPQEFDDTDYGIIHDVCEGPKLGDPVYALLQTLREVHLYENSFGLDKAKAFDAILPDLKKLREACKTLWNDR